jgi:hypothetical protein
MTIQQSKLNCIYEQIPNDLLQATRIARNKTSEDSTIPRSTAMRALPWRRLANTVESAIQHGSQIYSLRLPHASGASLQQSNRVLNHVERVIREIPEVGSTSCRTGPQLGILPVTEPNAGDFTVKPAETRDR